MVYLGIFQKITGFLKPKKWITDYLDKILAFKNIDYNGFVT